MSAYIKNYKDYVAGDKKRFNLYQALANAGTLTNHISVFEFLLNSTFFITDTSTSEIKNYVAQDQRAAASLLFLIPMPTRILASIALYQEDLEMLSNLIIPEYSNSEYITQVDIPSVLSLLDLASVIEEQPFNNYYIIKALDKLSSDNSPMQVGWQKELLFVVGLRRIPAPFMLDIDTNIKTKLTYIFKLLEENSFSINSKDFIDIACSNNRIKAGACLCNVFGYSYENTQNIMGIIELWLHQYSII